MQLKKSSSVCL